MRDGICDEALEWPDDEDFINARLQEIWGLEGWPCARLARAIRNQIGMLKGIQPPEFSQERFVIWAETLVHDLDEREMKKHLQAFCDIQRALGVRERNWRDTLNN